MWLMQMPMKGNEMNKPKNPKVMEDLTAGTRHIIRLTWQMAQLGIPLEAEQATLVKAMREHPDYADLWENLDKLSDAEIEHGSVNPILHVNMHAVVENQIAQRNPAEVREIVKALLRQGYSRHAAIHAVAGVMAEEMGNILKEQRLFDEAKYLRNLRKLIRKK